MITSRFFTHVWRVSVALAAWACVCSMHGADIFFYAKAKGSGSGTVSLTVNGRTVTSTFSGLTSGTFKKADPGTGGARIALVEMDRDYSVSVSTTGGVSDYVIQAQRSMEDRPYLKSWNAFNDKYLDGIAKSEVVGGLFTFRVVPGVSYNFGEIDSSSLETLRMLRFGMGTDSYGRFGGVLVYAAAGYMGGGNYMRFDPGQGTLWRYETSTHVQAVSAAGLMDMVRTELGGNVTRWEVRFIKGAIASFPLQGDGFRTWSGLSPTFTYVVDRSYPSDGYPNSTAGTWDGPWPASLVTITKTLADGDARVLELRADHYRRLLSYTSWPYMNTMMYQWLYQYQTITRRWPWRKVSAGRGALTETLFNCVQTIRTSSASPYYESFEGVSLGSSTFDGSTRDTLQVATSSQSYRNYSALIGDTAPKSISVGNWVVRSQENNIALNGTYTTTGTTLTTDATGGKTYIVTYFAGDSTYGTNLGTQPITAVGKTKEIRRAFLDNNLNTSQDIITSMEYTEVIPELLALPSLERTTQNGVEIGRKSTANTLGSFGGLETIASTTTQSTSASGVLTSVKKEYSPRVASADYRGRPVSVTASDQSRTVYSYQRGTLDGATWTTASGGPHLRTIALSGKSGSGVTTLLDLDPGVAIDPLDLDPTRSLATETIIDLEGRKVREGTYVFTGSGFAQLTVVYHTYDGYGRLTESADAPSSESGRRILYSAGYTGFWKSWEEDAEGVRVTFTYDVYDRVSTAKREGVDPSGIAYDVPERTTTYTYDGADRVKTETISAPGMAETLTTSTNYDLRGRVTSKTVPGQGATTTAFDSVTQTTTSLPTGGTRVEVFWKDGRKKSISGTAVPDVSYTYAYDGSGFLHSYETLSTGKWTNTITDWAGRVDQVQSPTWDGGSYRIVKNNYNSFGQVASIDTLSGSEKLLPTQLKSYDAYGRLLWDATDSNNNGQIDTSSDAGVVWHYWTIESRQLGRIPGARWYRFETEIAYPFAPDTDGTDRSGDWKMASQKYTQITGLSDGLTAHITTADAFGNWTESTTSIDRSTNRRTVETTFTGTSLSMLEVFSNGLSIDASNAQGHTFVKQYDGLGRPVSTNDPRTGATTYLYKPNTALVAQVRTPDLRTVGFTYDDLTGLKVCETDHIGKASRMAYDTAGNLTHVWGDTPNPVMYVYNDLNQRTDQYTYRRGTWNGTSRPDSEFNNTTDRDRTQWTYQGSTGLMTAKIDPRSRSTTFEYDDVGRISKRVDPRGASWVTVYEYFGQYNSSLSAGEFNGQLKRVDYQDAVGTPDVSYTYDRRGKVASVTDAAGTRTFNYYDTWVSGSATAARDKSGLIQTETLPAYLGGHAVRYDYQFGQWARTNGALSSVEIDGSATYRVAYGYDDRSRPETVAYMSDTAFTYAYLPNSNLIDTVTQGSATAYTYRRDLDYETTSDRVSRVLHRARYDGSGDGAQVESYIGYNPLGLRSTETTRGTLYNQAIGRSVYGVYGEYQYNSRNEVSDSRKWGMDSWSIPNMPITSAMRTFTYDPIGNRKTDQNGSYWPASDNRYDGGSTPYGSAPAYDDAGNMTSDGQGRTFEFDGENRLTKINQGGGWVQYRYDHQGRRIAKWNSGGAETRFIHHGWNVVAELNSGGAITKRFAWGLDVTRSLQGGGGIGGLLVMDSGGTRLMPFYDASYSVVGLYDSAGAMPAAYEYDSFGNLLAFSNGVWTSANPYRHATKYTDTETEITLNNGSKSFVSYYGYRFFHTAFGRFVNRDPSAETGGLNLYGFCGNDGINRFDYLGMWDLTKWIGGIFSNIKNAFAEEGERMKFRRELRAGADKAMNDAQIAAAEAKYGHEAAMNGAGRNDADVQRAGVAAALGYLQDQFRLAVERVGTAPANSTPTSSRTGPSAPATPTSSEGAEKPVSAPPTANGSTGQSEGNDVATSEKKQTPNSAANNTEFTPRSTATLTQVMDEAIRLRNAFPDREYIPAPDWVIGSPYYYSFRWYVAPRAYRDDSGPDYLLDFGYKNIGKFYDLAKGDVSQQLRGFVRQTAIELQRGLERALANDPSVASSRSRLMDVAYASHPDAYERGGFFNLTVGDQGRVGFTPVSLWPLDVGDVANTRAAGVYAEMSRRWWDLGRPVHFSY